MDRSFLLVASCVLGVAGCRSYEPRPLERDAHRAAWHARSVRSFVDQLELAGARPRNFDLDDGLDLDEAKAIALVLHPELRLARLEVSKAHIHAGHADIWQDPTFGLTALAITQDVPEPWVLIPNLTFTIPLSGRLEAERGAALARSSVLGEAAREAEWTLLWELEHAWAAWSAAEAQLEAWTEHVATVDGLARALVGLREAGESSGVFADFVGLEAGRAELERERHEAERRAALARLRALLGIAPEAALDLVPNLAAAALGPTSYDDLERRSPELRRLRFDYLRAEETLRAAVAAQVPDLVIGPQFERDGGQTRVGLTGALPVPVFHGNRHAIEEAEVEREIARGRVEASYERLAGELAAALERHAALDRSEQRLARHLVPAADRQLDRARRLVELGEGDARVLLESLQSAHALKLEVAELRRDLAQASADVRFLVGPEVPAIEPNDERIPSAQRHR